MQNRCSALVLALWAAQAPLGAAAAAAAGLGLRVAGLDSSSALGLAGANHSGPLVCGKTVLVHAHSDKEQRCPKECPFYAQDKIDDVPCSFVCVAAADCIRFNPKTPIGDPKLGVCRSAMVNSCLEPAMDGTDTCKKCQSWYYLHKDGKCYSEYVITLVVILVFASVPIVLVVVWMVDLAFLRPISNPEGLAHGEKFRERMKLHMPQEPGRPRQLWDLSTNLCRTLVAGPGMTLHFNFQAMVILWALIISLGWACLAQFVDHDLFILGTRKFGTPRANCILVKWGYETQQRLMWTKVGFLYFAYMLTFAGCLLHGVRQLRIFQCVDFENKTMKDFVALIEELPELAGNTRAEEDLKRVIEDGTGQNVVGVSVAWDFSENEELIMKALEDDLRDQERALQGAVEDALDPTEEFGPLRKKFFQVEKKLFGEEEEAAGEGEEQARNVQAVLDGMKSSTNAFVVFETEAMRDAAVVASEQSSGIELNGQRFTLEALECEPDTVKWASFGNTTLALQIKRLAIGFGCIFLALLFWTIVFYAPYAWSVFSFNYDNGQQPGPIYGICFSMVVVIGNAIMYEVCARVSDGVKFKFKDSREGCYMILYTIACSFNVLLDMVTTYFMAWEIIKGLHFRTYHGEKIKNVEGFNDRFESYAMQRSLAENTFAYAWPSTYLIPFLIEPVITIWVPLKLGVIIVRAHPEMVGRAAEGWLMAAEMEMGRYADIMLDIILAIMIFYFPGGYTHRLFFFLAAAHTYIYIFDHWRVLRTIPTCTFASMDVDWWAQAMLIPCCSLILSCMVFKANRQGYGFWLEGIDITIACCCAFWLHFIVHLLLLIFIVPMYGKSRKENNVLDALTYRDVASSMATTWFSTNPVHCLRSKLMYHHDPPCGFQVLGKEHLMQINESIGCYFKEDTANVPLEEKKSFMDNWRDAQANFKAALPSRFFGQKKDNQA